MTACVAIESCISEEMQCASSGHSHNPKPVLASSPSHNLKLAEEDPLAHPEAINIVQQSDTTFLQDEETNIDHSNCSFNHPMPIRNLWGTFEEMNDQMEEHVLLSRDDNIDLKNQTSPIGIEQYASPKKPQDGKKSGVYPFLLKIDVPHFQMCDGLGLDLPRSVIDRCSLYSVIHGINKEVVDMASNDQNCHVDELKDEGSALVQAVNGPAKSYMKGSDPQMMLAVMDEEKFILAAIASRTESETMIRDCPETFAEAIGESDALTISDDGAGSGHSENPLLVVSAMRTQLWKPSRSWWEAKSGKNPWIEPTLHNKRWRYLWPLIHYHKFLAKCIKKLKRNQVDVKTSLSPVSAFLRHEVCAVSDHLASVSKFGSEEWMTYLPDFQGWNNADMNPEHEQKLRDIIKTLPLKKLSDTKDDVESPHFRNIINDSFSKSMYNNREQMISGAGEYQNAEKIYVQGPGPNQRRLVDIGRSSMKGNRPPRHVLRAGKKAPRTNGRKQNGGRGRRHQNENQYPPNMMNPMNMSMNQSMPMNHSMYQYQFNQSMQYMPHHPEQNYYYGQNNWAPQMPPNPDLENMNYSFLDQSMVSNGGYYQATDGSVHHTSLWPPHMVNNGADVSVDMASFHGEDMSHCSADQTCQIGGPPPGVSLSFIGGCKTPSKAKNSQPTSPHWAHLNMAPCLASPGGHHPQSPQHCVYNQAENVHGNGQAHPPMMNYFNGSHPVPPSPATMFLQGKPAYFAYGRNTGSQQPCTEDKPSDGSSSASPEPASPEHVLSPTSGEVGM